MLPFCNLFLCRSLRRHLRCRRHHHKCFSTSSTPVHLPLSHPTYMIWGSNTSLGKTLVSTGIASSFLLSSSSPPPRKFLYIKPVQTGFPSDSDSRFVFSKLSSLASRLHDSSFCFEASNLVRKCSLPAAVSLCGEGFVGNGIHDVEFREENAVVGERGVGLELVCETLYAWKDAVSPHLAVDREGGKVEDFEVLKTMERCLRNGLEDEVKMEKNDVFCVVETAGGVASPGPSGTLQCDLYR